MEICRTFDLLSHLQTNHPNKSDILSRKFAGKWIKYNVDEYVNNSHAVARGLLAMGYKKETKVITICNNRPEWNFVDMGTALAGMIHIPVYPTLNRESYLLIFEHSDAEIIIIGNQNLYKKIKPFIDEVERDIKVILMDDSDELMSLKDVMELGNSKKEEYAPIITKNIETIKPEDCATIIYTSGTTGIPKGVMLSHRNLTFNALMHANHMPYNENHKMLSFLPLCHIYERSMNYDYQIKGISIYYAESLSTFANDLKESKADGFCSVPRVLEVMYGKLEDAGKRQKGIAKKIYSLAWNFANNFDVYNHGILYGIKRKIYDKLVYSKWRANVGGQESLIIVSGGSAIQAKIVRTLNAAKLYCYEGYGMTESSPVIAVNNPNEGINVIGTVGKPLEGTIFKIAEDGEILTKGPHVMIGYYKSPEQTAEIIDKDGFLHTGDIGHITKEGCVKITDRKKEIFKLSNGKYIAPQSVENQLKESSYIEQCIVFGDNEKFASALIIPNFDKVKEWARENGIKFNNNDDLIKNPKVVELIHNEVKNTNENLASYEQIKKEVLINDSWDAANGMLSQTLKLKRAVITEKYKDTITAIFS